MDLTVSGECCLLRPLQQGYGGTQGFLCVGICSYLKVS